MKRIGLLSDTHGYADPLLADYFKECDEIWHAGDFGTINLVNTLQASLEKMGSTPVIRGVYGNIDGYDIRSEFPEKLFFTCEGVRVMMQHIGGYPNRYSIGVKQLLQQNQIQLFISGHSHILKVMYDDQLSCLHMNPGAAGKHGWHKVRTIIRFVIDGMDIKDCEVIELGNR